MPAKPGERAVARFTVRETAPARRPQRSIIDTPTVRLEPINPQRHGKDLFAASHLEADPADLWRFMGQSVCESESDFLTWLSQSAKLDDPLAFAIVDKADGVAVGMASFMRIAPEHKSIEIGSIWFGPRLQRTRQATQALFSMMTHAFDVLGNRRLEWKCDAANDASRRAAERLGFAFEGIFFRHMIVKGQNRDTAWYSIIDDEWPTIRERIETWLSPDNFDQTGNQRRPLLNK